MRRSWLEVVGAWARAVPGPRWAVYVGSAAILALMLHVAAWADGTLPLGELRADAALNAALPPAFIWALEVLDRVALQSLARLRPALELGVGAEAALATLLVRTPAMLAAVVGLVGLAAGIASPLQDPDGWRLDASRPGPYFWATVVVSALTTPLALGLLTHIVHQLRVVDRLHRESVRVDLFDLDPLYAFASFTARVGALLFLFVIGITGLLSLTAGRFILTSAADQLLAVVMIGGAVACFIVPLLGLHDRIADEKRRRLNQAHATFAVVLDDVHARVERGELEGAGRLNDAIAAAGASVAAIARVSTWPWRPETLRGFISAVLLPIVLFLISEALRRTLAP
jgi:hypothetical protein